MLTSKLLRVLPLILAAAVRAQEGDPTASAEGPSPAVPLASTAVRDEVQPIEAGEAFVAANRAYDEGDYAAAIGLYRQLVESGVRDGRIHYNLGNAYLRNGELGLAVAEFRRAQILRPRDEDVRANLSFAREAARDAIAPPQPSPVLANLLFWHYGLSPFELAASLVIVNLLLWLVATQRLFRRDSEISRWIFFVLLAVLVGIGGSLLSRRAISRPVAVVLPPEIETHTAPDPESVVRFNLHAGTEIRVKEEREGWLRIVLPDGQQGWVESVWCEVVDGS